MQLDELRWFVAVVEDPNLTRVARALNVSQPALSRALRRVENRLGVQLFDRVGRRLEPNDAAQALAQCVALALGELDTAFDQARGSADPDHGEVRLAFLHTLGTWLVPELLGGYKLRRPNVRFHLSHGSAGSMRVELLAGVHDLILTSRQPAGPVEWLPLFDEALALAVPPDHRLADRRSVDLRDVAEDSFIVFRAGYGVRIVSDELCARAGFQPRSAFEGEDIETARGLVRAGLGVALIPRRPGEPSSPPLLVVEDPSARRTIGLAWHRERRQSSASAAFTDFVAETAGSIAAATSVRSA